MKSEDQRAHTSSLLREGDTCWKVATAARARPLIDREDYFATLPAALLQARRPPANLERRSACLDGWN